MLTEAPATSGTAARAHRAPADASRLLFEHALRAALGQPAHVVWTHNRVRLASGTRHAGVWSVRLHALFAAGGEPEARALADVLARRPAAAASGARLRLWFAEAQARALAGQRVTDGTEANVTRAPPAPRWRPTPGLSPAAEGAPSPPSFAAPPVAWPSIGAPSVWVAPAPALAVGRHTPALLAELFAELNAAYFHDGCRASIRWGRGGSPTRRRRRSMQLGCYDFVRREIRIHPALAEPFVPRYVVALVVYHEMLHEVFGLTRHNGRHSAHPPEFAVCEQSHPDYLRARAWEKQHLGRLLAWRA